ncbi:MAG TPA: Rpn family recombination-promoting nuclease/putative transposase [Tissierellales bacterium]|nr:Rpn family recombination-promoting nuclease/putative transposase [Tissierellales bacterium]
MLEKNEHFLLTEDLSIHYIELPKFDDKKDIEYMEAIELWLTFMKRIGEPGTEELLNQLMERSETLKMAKEILEKISADERLREKYYAREKARRDAISRLKYAERKGMEKGVKKGMEKGIKEGKQEERIKIAKNFLKEGVGIALVAKSTGLSKLDVEKLKEELDN